MKSKAKKKASNKKDPIKVEAAVKVESSNHRSRSMIMNMSIGFVAILIGLLLIYVPEKGLSFSGVEVSSNGDVINDVSLNKVKCNPHTLSQFLHEDFIQGMHLVCFEQQPTSSSSVQLTLYRGMAKPSQSQEVPLSSVSSWRDMESLLQQGLELPSYQDSIAINKQPWAMYTSTGQHLYTCGAAASSDNSQVVTTALESGMVLIMEGGAWIWPGVREGFQRHVQLHDDQNTEIVLETLSLRPLLFSVQHFISEKECDNVQSMSQPHVKSASGVSLMDQDQGKDASEWRTSQSAFMMSKPGDTLDLLEHRTSALTRLPISHQEHTQVLRYGKGQKYDSHHDYFDKRLYQKDPGTLQLIQHGKRNRLATVFWYLSDVQEGGHTVFPRYNGQRERSYSDCTSGIKVKPEKGKVIVFYSLKPNGDLDPLSLHGACPVEDGIKWAANKWVWNAPVHFVRH